MDGLFKKHFVGQDGFIWWIGQVVQAMVWCDNIFGVPLPNNQDIKGFGHRYKVRIMGYHGCSTNDVPDDELPWATLMYPVTAGGGGRASSQTANITQGTFVFGFFLDGENAQQPVIMGCIGYNDYNPIMKNVPENCGFIPFSGYDEKDQMATTGTKSEPGGGIVADIEGNADGSAGTPNNEYVNESAQQESTTDMASQVAMEDGQRTEALAINSDCRPIPTSKITQQIKNMINKAHEIQRAKSEFKYSISRATTDFDAQIQKLVDESSRQIAGDMKDILGQSQKNTIEKLNTGLKPSYYNVMPNSRQELKEQVEKANDAVSCQFRGLANGLEDLLKNFLSDAVKKSVNTPPCMVDNMIGNMMGQLANSIDNSLSGIFGAIDGLTGMMTSVGGALGVIDDVLSFLECEENPNCSAVTEWSMWSGPGMTPSSGMGDIANIAKGFSANFSKLKAPDFDFNLDMSEIFGANGCDSGPIACGPPRIEFFGGKGYGAAGNVIVSQAGEVMAVDMTNFGKEYDEDVQAKIIDDCGKGVGAYAEPVLGDWTDENGNTHVGIIAVNILEPGIKYLPNYDGSTGGDGKVWANPSDTSVTHENGDLEIPVPPGTVITVVPGDVVLLPPGTQIVTESLTPEEEKQLLLQQEEEAREAAKITTPKEDEPVLWKEIGEGTGLYKIPTVDQLEVEEVEEAEVPTIGGEVQEQVPYRILTGQETIKGGSPHTVERGGRFTSPKLAAGVTALAPDPGIYPASASQAYPVVLYLCEIQIRDPGWNYSPNDKISIEPNMGAVAVPKFDDKGRVVSIKMSQSGEGFQTMPSIWIRSETGFNAQLLPKFCIDRIAEDKVKEPTYQDKLLSVIDCVGIVPYPVPEPRAIPDTRRAFSAEAFDPSTVESDAKITTPKEDEPVLWKEIGEGTGLYKIPTVDQLEEPIDET